MSLQFLSDKETHPSQSHTTPVVSLCWAQPGLILSGGCDGTIKAVDPYSALCYRDWPRFHSNAVHCITSNTAGTVALSSSIDGSIALWDLTPFSTAAPPHTVQDEAVEAEAISQDPSLVSLPVQDAKTLMLAQLDTITTTHPTPQAKLSEAWKTALHPTEPYFASIGAGAIVSLHSLPKGGSSELGLFLTSSEMPPSISKQKDLFGLSLAFNRAGTLLAIGTNTGQVLLYTVSNSKLKLVTTYANHPSPIRTISFTAFLLLVGSDDRTVSVHDVKPILLPSQSSSCISGLDGKLRMGGTVASLSGHKGWVLSVASVPVGDRNVFASVAMDKSFKFWDLSSATKSTPVWNGGEVQLIRSFAFQPIPVQDKMDNTEAGGTSMTRFATGSEDGRLRFYRGAGLG
ncbi:uncharacterized protein MEPE_01400 [Melanopsichium pennsylvanicum]|uniref:WD40 repeat-like protein n=2 Tax=Melanopsichium pennsylvanicum TaxID=63383 RepID=A0AAJ5C3Q3_9BASI|nr:conserved hypothetical protein [Melanopsichium pennsylvanicum 4]SNX82694.1 uncharacterized protein MEPE_01400 [Melanopsichium pennsylvanicum]